ncbi:MAG TPA: tetratricopeptide repeat protein [Terriglobales bacterium]|nr:tetratricopeptide repeat protein [Terriglobales bacterium]
MAFPKENPVVNISDDVLAQLKRGITHRQIDSGMLCLNEHENLLEHLDPTQKNAARLVGYYAQWLDIGYGQHSRLKNLLARFSTEIRANLPLSEYVDLRLADGMLAMNEEAADEALTHFNVVLALGRDLSDKEKLALANFWKSRCLRKIGEYDEALVSTMKASSLGFELGYPKMAAVMQVLESWLIFQAGKSDRAEQILHQAEQVLRQSDDYVTLGNIHSSYGRMARRAGQYDKAILHFTKAIEQYRKRGSQHPHLVRTLTNIALVKQLISLHIGQKIDAQTKKRRKAAARGRTVKQGTVPPRASREQLREEAREHLEEAVAINKHNESDQGSSSIHLVYGYLYLDDGDYEDAEHHAATGLEQARRKNDPIGLSRLSLLHCMIENAKVEDEIGDKFDAEVHARQALAWAQDAIKFAKQTQNRRLLGNAYVWEGLTYANPFLHELEAAHKSYDSALALLKGDQVGQLWNDLETLKRKLQPKARIEDKLRSWSQGTVGEKSFQQILDEFTELIIPKIWENEGRKVSRVAARLSISPKKVRRILETVGARNGNNGRGKRD